MEFNRTFLIMMAAILFTACTNSFTSEEEFLKWLNKPKNGLVKTTMANGFELTLKYLPPEYLLYVEKKKAGVAHKEIQLEDFDGSMTFMFSVQHQDDKIDATNYGIRNMSEYKIRIAQLNFDLKKYLFIKGDNGERTRPVLSVFENVYEVGGKKSFYVVFPIKRIDESENDVMDIVFEDPFLDTGINHFTFNKNALNQIPILEFTN